MAFTDQTMIDKTDQWAASFNEAYMSASKGVDPERILEMREKLERRTKRGSRYTCHLSRIRCPLHRIAVPCS